VWQETDRLCCLRPLRRLESIARGSRIDRRVWWVHYQAKIWRSCVQCEYHFVKLCFLGSDSVQSDPEPDVSFHQSPKTRPYSQDPRRLVGVKPMLYWRRADLTERLEVRRVAAMTPEQVLRVGPGTEIGHGSGGEWSGMRTAAFRMIE
jgi:hypothetical protein